MKKPDARLLGIGAIAAAIVFILYISRPAIIMFDVLPHIRNILWIIFFVSGILLLVNYANHKKPPHPPNSLPGGTGVTGTVADYAANRIGDIDKLLLKTNLEKIWIHFPPHTAKEVMRIAPRGDSIHAIVRTSNKKAIDDLLLYDCLSVQSAGGSINIHELPPPAPAAGRQVTISGAVVQYKLDEHGQVSGIIIKDYIIDIPPHFAQTIVPLLKQAHEISVSGYERAAGDGFVNITGFILIKPFSITIDKTDYLL